MVEYLKDTYISKTTCRLLRYKLDKDLKKDKKLRQRFDEVYFTDDTREKIFCLINGINENPKCEYCENAVKFLSFSQGYRRFCCMKCSKNPEYIKNIDVFGTQKRRKTPTTKKTEYFKKTRRLTNLCYIINKDKLNPQNLPIGRMGVDGAYQLDHILSINYGFENNIPPEIVADISNLQVIPWRVNAVKNKYNIDNIDNISTKYTKKEYHEDLNIHEFIHKYCLDSSGKINSRITRDWFINRNVESKAVEIVNLTNYLSEDVKMPFRIFNVMFCLYKNHFKIPYRYHRFMRQVLSPEKDFLKLTGDEEVDYINAFMCYDKSVKGYRKKSNSYSEKETANKLGVLNLYYKYIDRDVTKLFSCSKSNDYPERE